MGDQNDFYHKVGRRTPGCEEEAPDVEYLEGEVPVREHDRGHQGPHVEGEAHPGGDDLDPDSRHVGRDGLWGEEGWQCGQRLKDVP